MAARHYRALVDGYRWTDAAGDRVSRVGDTHYLSDEQIAEAGPGVFDFATEADREAKAEDDRLAAVANEPAPTPAPAATARGRKR